MITLLKRLLAWIQGRSQESLHLTTGEEIMAKLLSKVGSIETEEVERKLKVRKLGRREGLHNRPETGEKEPDHIHKKIMDYFEARAMALRNLVDESVKNRLQAWSISTADFQEYDPKRLDEMGDHAARESERKLQARKHELMELRKKELAAKREWHYFKAENALFRQAVYPNSQVLHWAIIIALLLVESILNTQFFAKGSDYGLLGGWLMAFMISLMNIIPALAMGNYAVRWLYHVRWNWKIAGGAVVLLYFCWVLAANMVVGHYRALLDLDPNLAVVEAARAAWKEWLNFGNFDSIVLFFLGVFFSAAALGESFRGDDAYPGYGPVQRRYHDSRDAYQARRKELAEDVLQGLDHAIRVIAEKEEQFSRKFNRAASELSGTQYLLDGFRHSLDLMIKNCMGVIHAYRAENRGVRTSQPPQYFKVSSSLPIEGLAIPGDSVKERTRDQAVLDKQLADYKRSAAAKKHELRGIHKQRTSEVHSILDLMEREAYEDYHQDISEEKAARAEVRPRAQAHQRSSR